MALKSKARYTIITSGSQAGKTSVGPVWLDEEIGRCGPGDYLAVTSTYDLFNMKMLPELTRYFCDYRKSGRYHPEPKVIELIDPDTERFWARTAKDKMWGRIILRSAAAGSKNGAVGVGRLEAATAKAAWLDEFGMDSFTLGAWESVKRRLRINHGRVLGTTTLYNFGWLRSELYVPWTQGARNIKVIQFDSTMNPSFPLDEYEEARATMPTWKFNMQYRGIFDRPAGSIYSDFSEPAHVCAPFFIPDHWICVVGIDPGAVNTATVWLAVNPETFNVYLWRETLEGNITSEEHAKRAMAIAARFRQKVFYGGAKSETQFRRDWTNAGCTVKDPLISDVEGGIDKVIGLLKGGKFKIFKTCTRSIAQFTEYSRELDQYGIPKEAIKDKASFHLMDALRYAAPGIPRSRNGMNLDKMLRKQQIPGLMPGVSPGGFQL